MELGKQSIWCRMPSNHFTMHHRPGDSKRLRAAEVSMRVACGLLLCPAAIMLVSCLTLLH